MRLGRTFDPVLGIVVTVGNETDDLVRAFGRAPNNARNEIDRLSNLKLMHTNSSHCARMFRQECGRVSIRRRSVPAKTAGRDLRAQRLHARALHARDCCIPMTPGIGTTDRRAHLASIFLFQPPELITRQLDGFFYSRPREPVRRVLIGPEGTLGAPGPMVLRQFASSRITGKCVQIGSRFRYEHVNVH